MSTAPMKEFESPADCISGDPFRALGISDGLLKAQRHSPSWCVGGVLVTRTSGGSRSLGRGFNFSLKSLFDFKSRSVSQEEVADTSTAHNGS